MAQLGLWRRRDLEGVVNVEYIQGVFFTQDQHANLIGVEVYENGVPYAPDGSVSGQIIRADGGTVAADSCGKDGNKLWINLPQAAYAVEGPVTVILKLTSGNQETTLACFVGTVYKSTTSTVIDPGTIIPSIAYLSAQLDAITASIPASATQLWAAIAQAFSADVSYAKDDYVTYNSGLYRFTAAHQGSWSSSDVEAVALGDAISWLIGQVNGIADAIGTVPSGKTVQGQIDGINGAIGTVPSGKTVQGQIDSTNTALGGLAGSIAPEYADEAPTNFTAGSYCHHNGFYYRALENVASGSEWDSDQWSICYLANDILYIENAKVNKANYTLSSYAAETEKDFTGETNYNTIISKNSGKWSSNINNYSYIVAVPKQTIYVEVTANATNESYIAFLANDDHTNQSYPNYATGEKLISIPAGETVKYTVPNNCAYLYVRNRVSDTYYMPSSVKFTALKDMVNVEDVEQIMEEIGQTENQSFEKPESGNATARFPYSIKSGNKIIFYWETESDGNYGLTLIARPTSGSTSGQVTLQANAKQNTRYEVTPEADGVELYLTANASGTIYVWDSGTVRGDIKQLQDETAEQKEEVGGGIEKTFTKTGSSNVTAFMLFPVTAGKPISFYWETAVENPYGLLNLVSRDTSAGATIEQLKMNSKPGTYYTVTPNADAAGLLISATTSGTIHIAYGDTVRGDVCNLQYDTDDLKRKKINVPMVKFDFNPTMYNPSAIFASGGEMGDISGWSSGAESLTKVHAAFDALVGSGGAAYGYGSRVYPQDGSQEGKKLYKESASDTALFDILAPAYVTDGVSANEQITLDIGSYKSGGETVNVTYSYTYESDTDPYDVRLYKFQDTNSALHTESADYPKKKLLLIGGTHGNEFCAPVDLYVFAKHLCTDCANPDIIKLRSSFDVYIIPYLNGFGCQYQWNNGGQMSVGTRSNGHLVDINRNCDTSAWAGLSGSTTEQMQASFESKISNLGTNTAPGPSRGSEFESQLLKAIIGWLKPDVVIDHHHNNGDKPFYAISADTDAGYLIYQAANDAAYAMQHNLPQYYGSQYNLFLSSSVSPATKAASNGYVSTMAYEMGVKMNATEEMSEAIAYLNGEIDIDPQTGSKPTKAATRYSANAFMVSEYTLLNVALHLCQYALEHDTPIAEISE